MDKLEVVTKTVTREQLQSELAFICNHFVTLNENSCFVIFGFAWGNHYYPDAEWNEEEVPLESLIEKVTAVESTELGWIGSDDLFLKFKSVEFQFCHESDIHVLYQQSNEIVEFFYQRWKSLGYQPSEWLKNQKVGPGKLLREN